MIICAIYCVNRSKAQQTSVDSLCYLSDGRSSQTFVINEASQVDTVLGNLLVIGRTESNGSDPAEIELSIERVELSGSGSLSSSFENGVQQLNSSPIRIESKQLILNRQLDREAPEGENGITVHIRCNRLVNSDSNNQPIYIPVRIIITDANDHSPVFINAPYSVNVSESAPVYSQIIPSGIIKAIDADQEGPFSTVSYNVLQGPFSHMVRFESALGGALLLASPLDYESQPKIWVEIAALDQGEPPRQSTTKVTINVLDSDDQNPRFLDEKYSCIWDESLRIGDQIQVQPRSIKAIDPDLDINSPIEYQFNTLTTGEQDILHLDSVHGTLSIAKNLPPNAQFPRTYVLKAVQIDNPDRYALTTLTIYRRKLLDPSSTSNLDKLHFVASNYSASVLENSPAGQVILTVQVELGPYSHQRNQIKYQLLDNEESHFDIKDNGQVILNRPLDFEKKQFHLFRVLASDGTQTDICRVNITILNVNDHSPIFNQPYYRFPVGENKLHSDAIVGQVKATDEDQQDKVKLMLKGPYSNHFTINDQGILRIRSLNGINTTQLHFLIEASDNGNPPRTSSVPITVSLPPAALMIFSNIITDPDTDRQAENANGEPQESNHILDMNSLLNGSTSSSSALILVIVLGVLLATLFIIIITLTIHLLKQKRFVDPNICSGSAVSACSQRSGSHSPDGQLSFQHQLFTGTSSPNFDTQLLTNGNLNTIQRLSTNHPTNRLGALLPSGLDNPMFINQQPKAQQFKTMELDSAIVSDVSSNEGGSHSNRTNNNIPPPPNQATASNMNNMNGLSNSTTSNGLVWSHQNGSIPRRLKKLTWEDERYGGYGSVICSGTERLLNNGSSVNGFELDPDVSVCPIQKTMFHNHGNKTTPDCTVYF